MTDFRMARQTEQALHLEATGFNTSVPDNCVARLMYYVNCVACVTENHSIPQRLRDYRNYASLDRADKKLLMRLALANAPKDVTHFIEADDLGSNSNQFFKVSSVDQITTVVGVNQGGNEMVALRREIGNKRELVDVMAYEPAWARINYQVPLWQLQNYIGSSYCALL